MIFHVVIALLFAFGLWLLLRAWLVARDAAPGPELAEAQLLYLPGIAIMVVAIALIMVGALYGFVLA